MYRRAQAVLIGTALVMGALAVIAAVSLDKRLADPEGFLGPSWLRLPMLLFGAFLLDMLPRLIWHARMDPRRWPGIVRERWRTHWTRERLTLVVMGVVCFYIVYVSYRNLKSFLPFVMGDVTYDRELHLVDTALFLGHEPGERAARHARHHVLRARAVGHLPVVPAAGAARAHRLADLVAQHLLRLLVRHLAVHGLDAGDGVVLRAADARPGLSSTPGSTATSPTLQRRS